MKSSILIVAIFACFFISSTQLKSKSLICDKDTVVCIVDTSLSITTCHHIKQSIKNSLGWWIQVKGHYYDNKYSNSQQTKEFAKINISTFYYDLVPPPFILRVKKKDLLSKYEIYTDKWIHEQVELNIIADKFGGSPKEKCVYLVFKQDLNECNVDIRMYRVIISFNEIAE